MPIRLTSPHHPVGKCLRPIVVAGLYCLTSTNARGEAVALTFDDAPGLSATTSTEYLAKTNRILLAKLKASRVPAAVFVVGRLAQSPKRRDLVEAWARQGYAVGNHTYSHESLLQMRATDYIADIADDDRLLRKILDLPDNADLWFRHPYLETGATVQARIEVESWLSAHHYRIAPVTLENADWMFAEPYDRALLSKDMVSARMIRLRYLVYTRAAVRWYRAAALDLLGRRPDLVFLLHETRLNADCLEDLLAILGKQDLHPASLDAVMRDPAYAVRDPYVGREGPQWLTRWALVLHRQLPWSDYPAPPNVRFPVLQRRLRRHPGRAPQARSLGQGPIPR